MVLQRRTRLVLAVALVSPVVFLVLYPWACLLLPLRVQEWADLPRDLMGFLAADAAAAGIALAVRRKQDHGRA